MCCSHPIKNQGGIITYINMIKGFIKNQELLEEKVSDTDYLDFSGSIETLSEKLSVTDKSAVIGVIGAFGVGKSTLISKVKDLRAKQGEEWIHFDAWQFPERKELWEGLILETAKNQDKLKPILKNISGEEKEDVKALVNTIGDIPGLSVVKNLNHFIKTSPATRVFQLQDIFTDLINQINREKVVFVLEDVDRSGEAGLFFLETFRQFLNKTELKKKIVVIVAISNESYFNSLDTYLKCLDYVEFFHKKIDSKLESFIADVFESKETSDKEILTDFFNYIFSKYDDFNMRKLKLILRQANLDYQELERKGFQPNRLICIGVTTSKYLKANIPDKDSYFDSFVKLGIVTKGNVISRILFVSDKASQSFAKVRIVDHKNELQHSVDIRLVKRDKPDNVTEYPSTPYRPEAFFETEDESGLYLPDFYFKDL